MRIAVAHRGVIALPLFAVDGIKNIRRHRRILCIARLALGTVLLRLCARCLRRHVAVVSSHALDGRLAIRLPRIVHCLLVGQHGLRRLRAQADDALWTSQARDLRRIVLQRHAAIDDGRPCVVERHKFQRFPNLILLLDGQLENRLDARLNHARHGTLALLTRQFRVGIGGEHGVRRSARQRERQHARRPRQPARPLLLLWRQAVELIDRSRFFRDHAIAHGLLAVARHLRGRRIHPRHSIGELLPECLGRKRRIPACVQIAKHHARGNGIILDARSQRVEERLDALEHGLDAARQTQVAAQPSGIGCGYAFLVADILQHFRRDFLAIQQDILGRVFAVNLKFLAPLIFGMRLQHAPFRRLDDAKIAQHMHDLMACGPNHVRAVRGDVNDLLDVVVPASRLRPHVALLVDDVVDDLDLCIRPGDVAHSLPDGLRLRRNLCGRPLFPAAAIPARALE